MLVACALLLIQILTINKSKKWLKAGSKTKGKVFQSLLAKNVRNRCLNSRLKGGWGIDPALLRWIKPGSLYILRGSGLKWEKWKLSPRWQFKVNCKQKPCKIQLEYITYVCHVTNHAQFSTKYIDSKFPLFSNELLSQTPPEMRQNDFICS